LPIFRGTGGSGDASTDAYINEVAAYANTATIKANEASASSTNAASSASSASTSETNAASSASSASTSETNAASSASSASTSATNAASSASSASTSETNASTSETNAAASETNAASSASSASTSATNAASSASNAATSETNAATSETNAASSASSASTSETNAATSETNAASSASSASTSASNAATSATNAADSATSAAASAAAIGDLDSLSDVTITTPSLNQVLKYNGTSWINGAEAAEVNDLTTSVTWANVPDVNITQTSVTQHQAALSITESQISDFGTYLTSYTETDPVFTASAASGITATNITNWNTAFGWGNHASAGYITTVPVPVSGNWWNNGHVFVGIAGVSEVGKYLDFHTSDTNTSDFDLRLTASPGALDVGGTITTDGLSLSGRVTEEVFAVTGSTPALSPTNGTIQTWTLAANSTPTFDAEFTSGASMTLMIDDGAAYSITWPTIQWAGGSAPSLATTGYTVVELWRVGATFYGALVGEMS
jgi:hypothetical protein